MVMAVSELEVRPMTRDEFKTAIAARLTSIGFRQYTTLEAMMAGIEATTWSVERNCDTFDSGWLQLQEMHDVVFLLKLQACSEYYRLMNSDHPRSVFHRKAFDQVMEAAPTTTLVDAWEQCQRLCDTLDATGYDFNGEPTLTFVTVEQLEALAERAENNNALN